MKLRSGLIVGKNTSCEMEGEGDSQRIETESLEKEVGITGTSLEMDTPDTLTQGQTKDTTETQQINKTDTDQIQMLLTQIMLKMSEQQEDTQKQLNEMQAETQKQLGEIKNNNQTLQNTIQESIEKGNARIEKKIQSEIQEIHEKINLNNSQIREEISDNLNKVQGEIESNVARLENGLRAEVETVKRTIHDNQDRVKETSGQLTVLESRIIELHTQLEVVNERVALSENTLRATNKEIERNNDKINSQINSLKSIAEKESNSNPNEESVEQIPIIQIDENEPLAGQNLREENINCNSNVRPSVHSGSINNVSLNEIKLPRFSGNENDHPLRYIRDLELFFELRGIPERLKLSIVKNSFSESALWWMELNISPQTSYTEFKTMFIQNYWTISRQNNIRVEIVNGRYDPKKHRSYSEYFIMMSQKARDLQPVILQEELFSCLAKHFPSDIRAAIVVTRPQNAQEMLQLLRELQPSTGEKLAISDLRSESQSGKKKEGNFCHGERACDAPNAPSEEKNGKNRMQNNPNNNTRNHDNRKFNNGNRYNNNFNQYRNQGSPGQNNRFQKNSQGNWGRNSNFNSNRGPHLNNINFHRGGSNNANVPHWWKRPRWNGRPWRTSSNNRRFTPYWNNNGQYNNNQGGNNGPPCHCNNNVNERRPEPVENPQLQRVIDEQNDRHGPQGAGRSQGNNNESLNANPVQQ